MSCLVDNRLNGDNGLHGREIKNTVVLTVSFQIVFTAFNALQNLHSSVHDEERLGLVSLAVLYASSTLTGAFSPTIIGHMGARTVLVVFFLAHCIYVAVNFYPSFATMLPLAALVGSLFGPAWTSQSLYIAANADSYCKRTHKKPFVILERFNRLFFAALASSQIVGNLITGIVLHIQSDASANVPYDDDYNRTCGVLDCHVHQNYTELDDPHRQTLIIILSVYLICTALGVVLVISLLPPLPRPDWIIKVSARSSVTSCCAALLDRNFLLLIPFIVYTAVQNGFLIATYTSSYVSCPLGLYMVGYVMAAYGGATPILSFVFGMLAKLTGSFLCLTLAMGVHISLLFILYFWAPDESDVVSLFVLPVIWGVSECIILTQATSLITKLKKAKNDHIFATFHTWRSLGYFLTFICSTYLCASTTILLAIACALLALTMYVTWEFKNEFKERIACGHKEDESLSHSSSSVEVAALDRQTSTTPSAASHLMSLQERVMFDHADLNDVIKEVQKNWILGTSGPRLDIERAMSHRQLSGSKAMHLYQCRQVATFGDQNSSSIPRSLSDSHVLSLPDRNGAPTTGSARHSSSKSSQFSEYGYPIAHRDVGRKDEVIAGVDTGVNTGDDVASSSPREKIFCIDSDSDTGDSESNLDSVSQNNLKHKFTDLFHCSNQVKESNKLNFEMIVDSPVRSTQNTTRKFTFDPSGKVNGVIVVTNDRNKEPCSRQNVDTCQTTSPQMYRINDKDGRTLGVDDDAFPSPTKVQLRRSLKRQSGGSFKSISSAISAGLRLSKRISQLSRTSSLRSSGRSRRGVDGDGFYPDDDDTVIEGYRSKRSRSGKASQADADKISIY